ncbi:MAG: cytidine deaminase [Desulfarculus sp.]|nr:cytidine deaminase [Desulfarculus sp.]
MSVDKETLKMLLHAAKDAACHSYAPYSNYRVGAAVLTEKGVFIGANIENVSSVVGVCAEMMAIGHARMNSAVEISAIAIYCLNARVDNNGDVINPNETMPCGACRQWLTELAPTALVITNGIITPMRVEELLPKAFALQSRK